MIEHIRELHSSINIRGLLARLRVSVSSLWSVVLRRLNVLFFVVKVDKERAYAFQSITFIEDSIKYQHII